MLESADNIDSLSDKAEQVSVKLADQILHAKQVFIYSQNQAIQFNKYEIGRANGKRHPRADGS